MSRREIVLLVAGLAVGSLIGIVYILVSSRQSATQAAVEPRKLGIGYPAPAIALETLDGSTASLEDYRGHPVVLNYWATWCTPCREEMPLLADFEARYAPDLVVLGLNYGEGKDTVTAFVEENAIPFRILLDPAQTTGADYMVRGFPTTYFIDKEGILRSMHIGQLSEDLLAEYLKTIGLSQ